MSTLKTYAQFTCGAEGCGCEITVNFKDRNAVTIRGCKSHRGHLQRNIDREAHCKIDHPHQPFTESFDTREDAIAFIKEYQLDTEFKKAGKYDTKTKFHQYYRCSRYGTYHAKIDTKKNISKLHYFEFKIFLVE